MVCWVESVWQVRAWLADLQTLDPCTARCVNDALCALADKDAGPVAPVVVSVSSAWHLDRVMNRYYQRELDRLLQLRHTADVATTQQQLDYWIAELERLRTRTESIKATYASARAEQTLAEIKEALQPSGRDAPQDQETNADAAVLRPASIANHELSALFLMRASDVAILLFTGDRLLQ